MKNVMNISCHSSVDALLRSYMRKHTLSRLLKDSFQQLFLVLLWCSLRSAGELYVQIMDEAEKSS